MLNEGHHLSDLLFTLLLAVENVHFLGAAGSLKARRSLTGNLGPSCHRALRDLTLRDPTLRPAPFEPGPLKGGDIFHGPNFSLIMSRDWHPTGAS